MFEVKWPRPGQSLANELTSQHSACEYWIKLCDINLTIKKENECILRFLPMSQIYDSVLDVNAAATLWNSSRLYATANFFGPSGNQDMCATDRLTSFGSLHKCQWYAHICFDSTRQMNTFVNSVSCKCECTLATSLVDMTTISIHIFWQFVCDESF